MHVRVGDKLSNNFCVDMGVAQGSVLGPLIFLLFINDLPNYVTSGTVINFADDTTILLSAPDADSLKKLVRNADKQMKEWCTKNRLILNSDKTVQLYFGSKLTNLNTIHTTRFLGVCIDDNLKWNAHINQVCTKLKKAYYAILKLKSCMDQSTLLQIYYALAYSHIAYNILCWGKATEANRIFILQKRILRLIFNVKPRNTCKLLFKNYKLLTFINIFIYKCCCFVFQNRNLFPKNNFNHNYSTRQCNDYVINNHSTEKYKKSPSYSCVTIFNRLPTTVTTCNAYVKFKHRLKAYLCEKSFYTLNEFFNVA